MTVSQLVEQLQRVDGDRIVALQSNSGGSGYVLGGMWEGACLDDDAGLETLTDGDRDEGRTGDDVLVGGHPALFLYPRRKFR